MTTIHSVISTPGEILREEFLDPLVIAPEQLARTSGLSEPLIASILAGEQPITAETALSLSQALGTSAEFWLNLESHYQLVKLKKLESMNSEALSIPS